MAMNKVKVNSDVELKDRLVAINRVTKVTKGGRTFTFAAIVVVGDGNGVIGYGLGKAGEVTAAIAKGTEAAKKNLVKVPEPGEIYTGKVTRIMNFGAFVEILPGKEGLVHISKIAKERIDKVEDVLNVGDEVTVKVTEIDSQGRINLTRKDLL